MKTLTGPNISEDLYGMSRQVYDGERVYRSEQFYRAGGLQLLRGCDTDGGRF